LAGSGHFHGQGAPQVVAFPPGQTTGTPAAHATKSQACVPAIPGGHRTTHAEPWPQVEWQGMVAQVKLQLSPAGQSQIPLPHSPFVRQAGIKAAAAPTVVTMMTMARYAFARMAGR
jgi:hypothetical protein